MERRAFTVLELLVVISIISVLISLAAVAGAQARGKAKLAKCLSNLRQISIASFAYAAQDRQSLLLPVHPLHESDTAHRDGWFDYGGHDGRADAFGGDYAAGGSRAESSRPLNKLLAADKRNSVFRCPSDRGVRGGGMVGSRYLTTPGFQVNIFETVGTSYWGNAMRVYRAPEPPDGIPVDPVWSGGPFLRRENEIPVPSETLLYFEPNSIPSIMKLGTPGENGFNQIVERPQGWHTPHLFSAAYCDGHAATFALREGALVTTRKIWQHEFWWAMVRGPGFRFDCQPGRLILDLPLAKGE